MRPFFPYMGSKWTLAPRYGAPRHKLVIEPFAGSAAYTVRHAPREALLIDKFPKIVGIWQWLIGASAAEVRRLPIDFERVSDLDLPDGAKWLIGFWISKGDAEPKNTRSAWARQYRHATSCKVWNEAARERIASQVGQIRGWHAIVGDYRDAPDVSATWFIDPPYQTRGAACYGHHAVNYGDLAEYARGRRGQVIVCENAEASWSPDLAGFAPINLAARGTNGRYRTGVSAECAWIR